MLAASQTMLKNGLTVFDDSDVDQLLGGAELDWLLLDKMRDRVHERKISEVVN